ncbi:unnamed protein product [Ectocarpus sp. 12 AP-2014]
MPFCGARFRVPSAVVGVVALLLTTVLRLQRDETVTHSRQRGASWRRLMCADVVCCGSTNLPAKVSWGMPCRSGLMASLVENRFSALACALGTRGGSSPDTM